MKMKHLFILLTLLTSFGVHSQDQPKVGFLVFESYKFIGNKHLKPSQEKIDQQNKKFREFVKNNIDSDNPDDFIKSIPKPELAVFGDTMKCSYKFDIYKNFYELNTKCDYIKESNIERYLQIEKKTLTANTVMRDKNTNKYKISYKHKIELPSIPDNYELIEYRNDTKIINGYKCFKVVMRKKYQSNKHLTIYDFDMYVTEDININYSPITKYKEILNNYYPLEIIRKPRKEIMAEVTVWKIKSIDI